MTPVPVLAVRDLRVDATTSQGHKVPLLRGVTFDLAPREAVAIVGESGSGKSMTCAAIMRLLPSPALSISSGSIQLEGEDLLAKSPREMQRIRGRRLAMVVQDSLAALNPVLRVGHQVDEALRYHSRLPRNERHAKEVELFREVGIPAPEERLNDYPHQFSGGMRQRVVAAIALAATPALIIADEPTTALDPTVAVRVLGMLARTRADHGSSLLFVSHDIGLARRLCTRIMVMYGGRVIEDAPASQIVKSPLHPYTAALMDCLPSPEVAPGARLAEIRGEPPSPAALLRSGCSFAARCPLADVRCATEDPPTIALEDGRRVECWKPGQLGTEGFSS
jgi:oligopeptide/dipeptide ABC transporter ATP-binding protein